MIVASIRTCLKSVLRYKYLILCTYHDTPYIYVKNDVRIRGYFSKPRAIANKKKVWEIVTYSYLKWKVEEKLQAHYIHPRGTGSFLLEYLLLIKFQYATFCTVSSETQTASFSSDKGSYFLLG